MKKKIAIIATITLMISILQMPLFAKAQNNVNVQEIILEEATTSENIVDVLTKDGRFKTLLKALDAADLTKALQGKGSLTIFAPTDEAFAKVPKESLDNLLKPENKKDLINLLTYHVTKGDITNKNATDLNGKDITMLNGKKAKITIKDGALYINDIKAGEDIKAESGVIHAIDTVLTP